MDVNFEELVRNVSAYFNIVPNETDKRRLQFYLKGYIDSIPPKVIEKIKKVYIQVSKAEAKHPVRLKENPTEYMNKLAASICEAYGITIDDLKKKKKWIRNKQPHSRVDARQEFSKIAYASGVYKSDIADFLGYNNHSSIVHLTKYRSENFPKKIAI